MSVVSRVSIAGSSNARQEIKSEFEASMKRFSPYVFNAPSLPELVEPTGPKVALYRGKVPSLIPVEREDFYRQMAFKARDMKVGSTYFLCAGTGVGKSTRIPLTLVKLKQALGIVVVPTVGIRDMVSSYVKTLTASGQFYGYTVAVATKLRDVTTATSRTVLFMTATDLLVSLACDRNLFIANHVGFLYIDEFHEPIPQYYLLNCLIHASWFSNTVVLLGSATGAVRMEERVSGDVPHRIERVPSELMAYEDMNSLPVESPLHHARMTGFRTLVFLPLESDFTAAESYYLGHNIRTFTLTYGMSHESLLEVFKKVSELGTCVVLATQAYEAAYTLPINNMVNTGYTVDLHIDTVEMRMELVLAEESETQTTQRCGRVGRLEGGVAYTRDCPTYAGPTLTPGSEIYVALWLRVLGATMHDERIDGWSDYLSTTSFDKVLSLLRSSVHAVVIRDYFGSQHVCLRYSEMVLSDVLRHRGDFKVMDEHYSVYTSAWRKQVLNLRIGTYDYKAVWMFGDGLRGIPAYLFFVMQHGKSIAKSVKNFAASNASSRMDRYGSKAAKRASNQSGTTGTAPRTPTSVRQLYEGSPSSAYRKHGERLFDDEIPFGSSAMSTVSSSVSISGGYKAVYEAVDGKRGSRATESVRSSPRPPTFRTTDPAWKGGSIRDQQDDDAFFASPLRMKLDEELPPTPRARMARVGAGIPFSLRLQQALHDHVTGKDRSIPFGPSSQFCNMVFIPVKASEFTHTTEEAVIPLNNEAACKYFLDMGVFTGNKYVRYSGGEGGTAWVNVCRVWNESVSDYAGYKTLNVLEKRFVASPKYLLLICINNFKAFERHGVRFAQMPSFATGFTKV